MPHSTEDSNSDQPSLDDLISLKKASRLSGLSAGHFAFWSAGGSSGG
jgi:hypothetical protein